MMTKDRSTDLVSRRAVHAILRVFLAALVWSILALPGCPLYNVLVSKEQACEARWADVQAQLQRRYDRVPHLVATVKGSAKHEEDTLAKATEARRRRRASS